MKRILRVVLSLVMTVAMLLSASAPAFAATNDPPPHNHNWDADIIYPPTCTEDGMQRPFCTICGQTGRDETIPALGHDWRKDSETPATCTAGGSVTYKCARCGITETSATPALGHLWGDWHTVQEPGNDVNWGLERSCKRCGLTETVSYPEGIYLMVQSVSASPVFVGGTVTVVYETFNTGTHPVSIHGIYTEDPIVSSALGENASYLYPGDSCTLEVVYEVTAADVNGFTRTMQTFAAVWDVLTDPNVTAGIGELSSNIVTVTADVIEPDEYIDIMAVKYSDTEPANGYYFTPGEVIDYHIMVSNHSNVPVEIHIWDEMCPEPTSFTIKKDVAPEDSAFFSFHYTVTEEDAERGYITNTGSYYIFSGDISFPGVTNTVTVRTGTGEQRGLSLTKSISSTPLFANYYFSDETISFTITVTNTGSLDLYNVAVFDFLSSEAGWELISYPEIKAGESETVYLTHIVTEEDIIRTYVDNVAFAYGYDKDGNRVEATSNQVVVPTSQNPQTPPTRWLPEEPIEALAEGETSCERLLIAGKNGSFAYSIDNCGVHTQMDAKAAELAKDGTAEGWNSAADLWRGEMDELYRRLYKAAPSNTIATVILSERSAFNLQLQSTYDLLIKEYPDQPEIAAQRAAELLKNKVTDLCWLMHNVPTHWNAGHSNEVFGAKGDSLCTMILMEQANGHVLYGLSICKRHDAAAAATHEMLRSEVGGAPEHYLWEDIRGAWQSALEVESRQRVNAATDALRNSVLADSNNFDLWLNSYEEFIGLFYEGQDSADKAIALAMMDRVLNNCGTPEERTKYQEEKVNNGKGDSNSNAPAVQPPFVKDSDSMGVGTIVAIAAAAVVAVAGGAGAVIVSRRKKK